MAYDALADFADADERRAILNRQRWPLLAIGVATGSLGAIPGLLWLGGVVSVILFPLLAALAIWLYLLVFVFSGLWFQHYCLDALGRLRSTPMSADDPGRIIDIN
jgi:fatty acid desaturase